MDRRSSREIAGRHGPACEAGIEATGSRLVSRLGRLPLSLALVASLGCAAALFAGATSSTNAPHSFATASASAHYDQQPPYARTPWGGDRIILVNSESAVDPTWEQLLAFLRDDHTDEREYDPLTFPCGAFAEELHNNAEANGIRAAWVAIAFSDDEPAHALNAFETTDRGLVWIDCTPSWLETLAPTGDTRGNDKVAYVEEGGSYGLVALDDAAGPDCSSYAQYRGMRTDHGASPGLFRGSPGTVSSVEVYW